MPSVRINNDLGNVENFEDGKRFIGDSVAQIVQIMNGNLEFGPNVRCSIVEFEFVALNTSYRVPHGLNRVPSGYFVVKCNAPGVLFDGPEGAGTNYIYLQSSTAMMTAKILIF